MFGITVACSNLRSTNFLFKFTGSDDFSVNMCEKRDLRNTEMSLIFDQSLNSLSEPSSCICETSIIDGDEIEVNYIDVRMMRAHSETGSGSVCSSAALRGEPDSSGAQIKCNESLSEEFNLKANILVRVPVNETTQLRIILENLFVNGKNDSPVLVWLRLKGNLFKYFLMKIIIHTLFFFFKCILLLVDFFSKTSLKIAMDYVYNNNNNLF